MSRRIFLIFACTLCTLILRAQSDFDLTQRWFNESLYNPAAVGNSFSSGIFLHARPQWIGLEKSPITYAGTFDTYVETIRSGFGITMGFDEIGLADSYNVRLAYAYYIPVTERSALSIGFSAGMFSAFRRVSSALIDVPNDPEIAYGDATEYSPDFDFGLEYKGPFKAGISIRHIGLRSFTSNFPRRTLTAWAYLSSRFNVNEGISIEPLASLSWRTNVYRMEGGVLVYFFKTHWGDVYNDRFWVGGVYRSSHNFAVLAGMHITPTIRIGYSFDYGLNDVISIAHYGTHEVFVAFQFNRIFYKEPLCPAYRSGRR